MRIKTIRVAGLNNRHKVLVYALSTCAWCKKTKKFLSDNNIEYEYVDVDLCSREEVREVRKNILDMGGRLSYPAIIIDEKILINGFHEEKIKEALKN